MEQAILAIAEPRRREILRLVRDAELPAGEIAARFDVTRPAISQHLSVLKAAGLVNERREGTRRLYSARPEGLEGLRRYLAEFWAERLDRLAEAAEADERSKRHDNPKHKRSRRNRGARRR
jgi:DNA-binding transcriptional ArsR family regulator